MNDGQGALEPKSGGSTFVGFGFGAIQAGLFVLEALRSGHFGRIVIGEVLPDRVRSLRENGGIFRLNIAHPDRIETVDLGPVELENPTDERDRERLLEAIVEAREVATAVPSVRFYQSDSPGSIHSLLANGLLRRFRTGSPMAGNPVVVYAAENHNQAAEILEEAVLSEVPTSERDLVRRHTRFLNTVIGKMSGVLVEPDPERLSTITPRDPQAFLVESFNRILISRIHFDSDSSFQRGIEVFEEKEDLLPFEEAKLYGHNAAHALAAYLAARLGLHTMDELRRIEGAVDYVRAAFLEESGAALIRKWKGVDPLFTDAGYRDYVDDLLDRMLNPHLGDRVDRVTRDPLRKLGWDDRLVGTLRLALEQDIVPSRFALGVAAALLHHDPRVLQDDSGVERCLDTVWEPAAPAAKPRAEILRLVQAGLEALRTWDAGGPAPFEV